MSRAVLLAEEEAGVLDDLAERLARPARPYWVAKGKATVRSPLAFA